MTHELDRRLFIMWVEGVLLDRDAKGNCVVLDGSDFAKRAEVAEKAMENGETIYLTVNGKCVTKMYDDGEGYVEEEV